MTRYRHDVPPHGTSKMIEDEHGTFILFADVEAELDRLKRVVEQACQFCQLTPPGNVVERKAWFPGNEVPDLRQYLSEAGR